MRGSQKAISGRRCIVKALLRLGSNRIIRGILLVLAAWYGLHFAVDSNIVPSPHNTLVALFKLVNSGLLLHMLYSLYRITASVSIAILAGVPLGLWTGLSKRADSILSPVIYILYPVPKAAMLPVLMLLLGLGDLSKIMLIITIIVFQILIAVRDGVREIPGDLRMSVKSLGLSRGQTYIHLVLPAILPKLISALRTCVGISFSILFFAENFATSYGIGYFIMNSWTMVNYTDMFAGITALSLMGIVLFLLIDKAEHKLCPWVFLNESKQVTGY